MWISCQNGLKWDEKEQGNSNKMTSNDVILLGLLRMSWNQFIIMVSLKTLSQICVDHIIFQAKYETAIDM